MRLKIKQLVDATNVIDHAYFVKSRSMAVKPNIVVLLYALANDDTLSQSKLHNDWLLPLSTINTIVKECRNNGYIILSPIPGKRRECYLRFTQKGREFADALLAEIHQAEEKAMRETIERFSPEFTQALDFYAKTFHTALNHESGKNDQKS
ncbi:hypothetical protein SDC9_191994 [bioreactor metagenome]|uniref:HTH marR-type domain-containing protein n=1 Tax=bioreactor metagenome TaxID=1076179 RepID=A0A645I1Y8_9ZZZZ